MKAWPKVKLGEVLRRRPLNVDVNPGEEYEFAGVYSFGRGVFRRESRHGSQFSYRQLTRLETGNFVYPKLMAWEGAFGLVPPECDGCCVSPEFPVFEVSRTALMPDFLGHYFRIPRVWEEISGGSTGTNVRRRRLNSVDFLRSEIPLPPLAEQRRVVARLEELAAQIHEAIRLRQQAEEEAEALWERAAADILENAAASHATRQLSELVEIRGGGTPSKSDPFYWDGHIPWITPKDMKRRELSDAIDHISERATRESPAKLIVPGAVLVVVRGMILAHTFPAAVLRVPAAINQDMKALVPNPEILPEFLCAQLSARNEELVGLVAKSTHDTRKFETDVLLSVQILVPPLPDQRRIVAELNALQAEVDALKRHQAETAAELDALLPAILDRAFKGEL
ncbi:MAG: restriction endonuclease subunit S [Opitutaceae bacterium]|nr:restriction endonuclease subunit S [Opitutaceae bacterium]